MFVSGLTLAPISTPMAPNQKLFGVNRSAKFAHSFQVRCEGSSRSRAPDTVKVARREIAFGLTAVCMTLATVNAEARVLKPELRSKILEKLEMPREKAGLSKQKDEGKKDSPPPGPPPSLLGKEKNPTPLEPPPLPLDPVPTLSESITVVETAIPLA